MLGHAAIAESAIADVGGGLILATAEMNALATSSNVGVGTLVGVSSISGNFTKTTAGILVTGSVNAEISSNFTQTVSGISILSGVSSQDLNFTSTSSGDILFVEINSVSLPVGQRPAGAPTPGAGYTEITPTGVETYTEITPSGTETYTEIAR
jgi:molybdopterin-binding protein